MKDILYKNIVLVLNRNWQAINTTTPADVFGQMATDAATGLDVHGQDWMVPVTWAEWLALPVRDQDLSIGTARGQVRVPTVVVLSRFDRVPMMRPKFSLCGLWHRDGGMCQYTGRKLTLREGNIDHVLPQSRGGATSWENCVLSDREVNQRKADRTPREAGLELRSAPVRPPEMPATWFIRNAYGIPDWEVFLPRPRGNNEHNEGRND
ncbi:MAG: HNH endonuclease [Verrucomicrobia bacterium]|nr:HNH endonuclease [Verrucomicrobiota bacterium]